MIRSSVLCHGTEGPRRLCVRPSLASLAGGGVICGWVDDFWIVCSAVHDFYMHHEQVFY
jgi:hypothetical protein